MQDQEQFWQQTLKGWISPALVQIGLVVSEEKIFFKVYDWRQVMAKIYMILWVRWTKKNNKKKQKFYIETSVKISQILVTNLFFYQIWKHTCTMSILQNQIFSVSIKIRSLTCFPLLIYTSWRGRFEETTLRVTFEWPYVPSNENGDCETMKELLHWFPCYWIFWAFT